MSEPAAGTLQVGQEASRLRLAVLTEHGSRYGLKLLNALQWEGHQVNQLVLFSDLRGLRWRWLRGQARRMGWPTALACVAWRTGWRLGRRGNLWRGRTLERDYHRLATRVDRVPGPRAVETLQALEAGQPDLCLLGQSGILPARLLTVPRYGTLNAHPSLLPDYRGLDPTLWAMYERRFDRIGTSLHLVDAGVDTGPILEQRPYHWRGDETLDRLLWRINDSCLDLLVGACSQNWPGYGQQAAPQQPGRRYSLLPPWQLPRVQRNLRLLRRSDLEAGR
jgi:hypothetical protein